MGKKEYKRILFILCILFLRSLQGYAIKMDMPTDSDRVVTNSFWDNWYGQVGVDMHLQFPKGHNMADVFPNGKSFGIDIAIGKWFSPEFGGRFKVKWNNGILKNDHNTWLRPYGVPGGNHEEGGFITFIGDMQFNLHNIFGTYKPDRKWNIIASPRFGGWYDLGNGEGSPVLGVGVVNTYRLSDRWRLFADIGYFFVGSLNGVSSGTGHGSNGYGEIYLGVEMDLSSKNKFDKASGHVNHKSKSVVVNSFWDNWFVQAGIGMSLVNAYGTNFANVFPNGKTFGVNIGLGKWFSPEIGIRGGLNWQNGIIGNDYACYLDGLDLGGKEIDDVEQAGIDLNSIVQRGSNKDKHGYAALYADCLFNLHSIIAGYDPHRKWNCIVFPRMGIAKNFSSEYDENPIVGIGTEQTFTISNKWEIYADLAYQVVTSGFLNRRFPTGAGAGANGWFDLNVGIQYDFGKNWWDKPGRQRKATHWEGGHNWPRFFVNTGASVIVAFGTKTALKAIVSEERPDQSDNKSFPSGHASMAFAAARSIDKEFRKDCIWIPIAGYAAATVIGVERVVNKHHHWYDVAAGAAIGIGSAELTWWLSDIMFAKHNRHVAIGSSGNTLDVAVNF